MDLPLNFKVIAVWVCATATAWPSVRTEDLSAGWLLDALFRSEPDADLTLAAPDEEAVDPGSIQFDEQFEGVRCIGGTRKAQAGTLAGQAADCAGQGRMAIVETDRAGLEHAPAG